MRNNRRFPFPIFGAFSSIALVTALFSLTGCARDVDPEDLKDLSSQYQASDGPLGVPETKAQSECRAKVLLEADLSDKARARLLETGVVSPVTEEDRQVLKDIADDLMECV